METIDQLWKEYAKNIYPDGMTQNQEQQLRQSFSAGFMTCFLIVEKLGDKDVSENKGLQVMNYYLNEVNKEVKFYTEGNKNG